MRHDIDFDIEACRWMLEVEKEMGFSSIVYVDVHNPSYSMHDIVKLYDDFHTYDFHFGIHINVTYDHPDKEDAILAYKEDIMCLQRNIDVHSCSGHFYSAKLIPRSLYNNMTVELDTENLDWGVKSFNTLYPNRIKFSDSAGKLRPLGWLNMLPPDNPIFILTHPVNYYKDTTGNVIYTKLLGWQQDITTDMIKMTLEQIRTSAITVPFEDNQFAIKVLQEIIIRDYRKLIRVIDIGNELSLLAPYVLPYNNVKYIGINAEPNFIETNRTFLNMLGYHPNLIINNFHTVTKDDIVVQTTWENCFSDFKKI